MEQAAAEMEVTNPEPGCDGVALLRWVYNNRMPPLPMRIDAAKAAARYERPALSMARVEATGADGGPSATEARVIVVLPDNGRSGALVEGSAHDVLDAIEAEDGAGDALEPPPDPSEPGPPAEG